MSEQAIEGLKPELVWKRFYEISQVPRPSKKEEKIRKYVKDFITERNLEYKEDEVGNVVIKVPATEGYEKAPVTVIQGHVDMVPEKNKGTKHDFENDPIKLMRDGDWITADGTTLGADNGIGVAAALATVDDKTFDHGPLEILLTVDEETGLTGANNLKPGFVTGNYLLNTDSEEDGAFYIGCSGGQDTVGYFDIPTVPHTETFEPFKIVVTGLKGGHSGLDIQEQRANAIKLLGRTLKKLHDVSYEIAYIEGGSKRNAIPREAEAVIQVDPRDEEKILTEIKKFNEVALGEHKATDPNLKIELHRVEEKYDKVYTREFSNKLVNLILALPHGFTAMSKDIEGLVETSTNLATIEIQDGKLRLGTSQRSSVESAKFAISQTVASALELACADDIVFGDGYPGWKPDMDSNLLKLGRQVYEREFGEKPELKAIHAGLECGILGDRYPGIQMISFGPTIENAHSPDERLNIKDVEKFYKLTKAILTEIAKNG